MPGGPQGSDIHRVLGLAVAMRQHHPHAGIARQDQPAFAPGEGRGVGHALDRRGRVAADVEAPGLVGPPVRRHEAPPDELGLGGWLGGARDMEAAHLPNVDAAEGFRALTHGLADGRRG